MKKYFLKLLIAVVGFAILLIAYLWFKPHRNVANSKANEEITVEALTEKFIKDPEGATTHYLSGDGNSMILIVMGVVSNTSLNSKGEPVIYMKSTTQNATVMATIVKEDSIAAAALSKGAKLKIKGVIIAGNQYDPILDFSEPAILTQCTIVK